MHRRFAVFCLLVLGLGACLPSSPSRLAAPITAGQAEPGEPAVCALTTSWGAPLCSCVLIADRLVLTTAHCLEGHQPDDRVFFGAETPSEGGLSVGIAELRIHPEYREVDLYNDVAVILLSEAVDPGIRPRGYNRVRVLDADFGAPIKLVGFGRTGADNEDQGVKRSAFAVVDTVDSDLLLYDADPSTTCAGDSGGPVFGERAGVWSIWGISRAGDVDCERGADAFRTDAHLAFIDGVFDEVYGTDDPCDANDWYDDRVCDSFCPFDDPDVLRYDLDGDGVCDEVGLCEGDNTSGDFDGDGFCLLDASGAVLDCDDRNPAAFPGGEEVCDGADNDCDGAAPDEQDSDGDGELLCEGDCSDWDGPGRCPYRAGCKAAVNPGQGGVEFALLALFALVRRRRSA